MSARLGRLTHPDDFSLILRSGTRTSRNGVVLAFCPSQCGPRLGFAVGRAAGNAVHRNRFRRVIRELLRQKSLPAVDMVITARAPIRDLDNQKLRQTVETILEKNGWLS